MRKHLAILGLLVPLAIVGTLAGQDVPQGSPKNGIVKQESSKKGQEQPQIQSNNQIAPNSPTAFPQPTAPSANESAKASRENLQIQRWLVYFTGGLVVVGFLQVLLIGWQAILLRKTREDVHEQAGWMKEQTGRMSRQADLMSRQNVFARESITATKNAADAAKLSAESTLAQFQAMKAKERARVWIGIDGDLNLGMGPFSVPVVYVVTQTGPTDGFVYASFAKVVVSEVDPEVPLDFHGNSIGVPSRVAPQFEKKMQSVFLYRFSQAEVESINAKISKVYFMASIRYKDIFGDLHETSIMQRWRITDLKNIMGKYGNFAFWTPCGPPEANRET